MKVLLADKRELFREGLSRILQSEPNIQVVATCCSGDECVDKAVHLKPQMVMLDTEIEGCDFIETTRRISRLLPETFVLILTHSEEDSDVFSGIRAGAKAYLSKDVCVKDLIRAVLRVAEGEVIISPPMAARLLEEFRRLEGKRESDKPKDDLGLSKREAEVLALVSQGKTNKDIASSLFITENTVKVHLSRILEKLHVRNRQQAVIVATEKGIVTRLS